MARSKGTFNFSANLEVKKAAPLDSRIVADSFESLLTSDHWDSGDGTLWVYNGLVVSIPSTGKQYMLTNYDPKDAPNAYTEAENWVCVDASAAKIDVIANLESTDDTKALAASQGKALSDKIEEVKTSLSSVYSYKGSVDNYADLPSADQKVGDTYNVVNANGNIPAGTNYAWNGESWDALGGSIDLSGYYTKEQTDEAIKTAKDAVAGQVDTLSKVVGGHTDALNKINGEEGTTGSLLNVLKQSKDYTDTKLENYVEKVEGSTLITEEKLTLIDTLNTKVSALETATADLTTLKAQVETNKTDIATLKGNSETEGSVDYKIVNALSWEDIK